MPSSECMLAPNAGLINHMKLSDPLNNVSGFSAVSVFRFLM